MIYESPDHGDTVYRRLPGSLDRELVKEGPEKIDSVLWSSIIAAGKTNQALRTALEQCIVLYKLIK